MVRRLRSVPETLVDLGLPPVRWRAERAFRDGQLTDRGEPGQCLGVAAGSGEQLAAEIALLRPLPYPDPERLVVVSGTAPGSDLPERFGLGFDFYLHYKENSQLLDGIFVFGGGTSTFRTEERVERITMNPILFVAMSVVMMAIGMLASYMPARRASSVNPIVSMRMD